MQCRAARRTITTTAILAAVLVSTPASEAAAQTQRPLQIMDLFALRQVGDPQISPAGDWVAYTVRSTNFETGKSETRIWTVPLSGGEAIPMTALGYSASRPRWSPDGRYLSFVASKDTAKSQVWLLDRRGGEAQQLTHVEQGVGAYDWSPDATRLLISIRDPEEEDPDEDKDAPEEPWVIDRLQFKRDGTGYLTGDRRTHLYVFRVADRKLWQITRGRWDDNQGVWSPDGTRVAFVSNRTDDPDTNANSDIWVVPAAEGADNSDVVRVTRNPGSDGQPAWSPDGRTIAYITVTEPDLIWYATGHLALTSADGTGEPRILSRSLDRNISGPEFTADGRALWVRIEDSAEEHLARVDVASGEIERPIAGHRTVGSYDVTGDGAIAAIIAEPHLPDEVFTLRDGALQRLTTVNDSLLSSVRLAEVRNVQFPSADGTEIEGFLYLPLDYQNGTRYPTLLRIHGGPVSQYSASFNFDAQLFAANGYAVVMTNPRGSSGYGQAFSHAIWADWGNLDYQDVMAGVDYAIREGVADSTRLGVGGWSYGGILTNYVITQTDRFEGAVTGASEVFYPANYGHDHYQRQWEAELGLPWENMDLWLRLSPFMRVTEITTPTLILVGEKDWNVPALNSEQLYQALKRLGVPTQLVVYPGESHGIRTPAYQKDRLERYLAWYDRWVRQAGPTAAAARR
ncbi:MAG: S9 family peptidase [Longimicrobiales bacterium]